MNEALPTTCCKNISNNDKLKLCDQPAKFWYHHNDDICSYCEIHKYECGEPIEINENE